MSKSIGLETIAKRGVFLEENENIFIVSKEERIALNAIYSSELIKFYGIGTMIKILNGSKTIFLASYRMFFNIGTGFAILNYFGTLNIKKRIDVIRNLGTF